MNPAQIAVIASITSAANFRIVSVTTFSSTTSSLDIDIPNAPGMLCLVFATANLANADTAPSTLTGFTSLYDSGTSPRNGSGSVNAQYKFLNGSEASTLTTTTGSSAAMSAVVYLIDGASPARTPNGDGTALPSPATSINPPPVTVNGAPVLAFVCGVTGGGNSLFSICPDGFSTRYKGEVDVPGGANGLLRTVVLAEKFAQTEIDPSSFSGDSRMWAAATVVVRGL